MSYLKRIGRPRFEVELIGVMRNIFIICIGFFMIASCSEKTDQVYPIHRDMTEVVYASVRVQPDDLYNFFSPIPGIINELLVEEGDTVLKDEIIARIIADAQKINLDKAKSNNQLASKNLYGKGNIIASIEDEISLAKSQLLIDSSNHARQKRLWDQNIGSLSEYENRKLKYDLSANNIMRLKNKLLQTKLELENVYSQTRSNLRLAKSNLADAEIKSKNNGVVYSLFKEPGEVISQQQALGKIGSADNFILEFLIDEVDIARMKLGQSAIISLDAFSGKVFEAKVSKIYPVKDDRTQTFKVEAEFVSEPEVLYAGLSGEANILIASRTNVLTIPTEFLIADNTIKTEEGELKVNIGLRNIDYVEVLSGLDSNTSIIKP